MRLPSILPFPGEKTEIPVALTLSFLVVGLLTWVLQRSIYRVYFSPLSRFQGPFVASTTSQWKAYIECFARRSFCHVLKDLHAIYGEVVRVGPNELHFSNPQAYFDIYNNKNRWDKDARLYHSFNEDQSSFGFITYMESKERKDVLNRMFSPKAVTQAKGLILNKINALCNALERETENGKPTDLFWAFRCLTMDIVTYLCFGASVEAIEAPGFAAPILKAIDVSLPILAAFKYYPWYKNMILGCPPTLSKIISPSTAGMVDLQIMIKSQIQDLTQHPEKIDHLPHNMTIYHCLMDKEAYRKNTVPSELSLYQETQALLAAGSDTTGNALMVGTFYLLKNPGIYGRFREEIETSWATTDASGPDLRVLESMPYLNAVIKESLRLSVGVVSGLPRVTPKGGATIAGTLIPGDVVVSCSATFVHFDPMIFPQPFEFQPERWLDNTSLENWLVAFSRGPRACIGINLAWLELRLAFAHVFHRFDMSLAAPSPDELSFLDCFLPHWLGPHVHAKLRKTC